MRKVMVFNSVTLDGYFADVNGDMSWAHKQDAEWNAFVTENARRRTAQLLFGRVTYEMMAGFWPTPAGDGDDARGGRRDEQHAEGRVLADPGQGRRGPTRS